MNVKKIQAVRYHDISTGHRVCGHENKCRHIHGHNYRVHFYCEAEQLDSVGRVVDFGVIKERLCMWLEDNWDHKFLHWENDLILVGLARLASEETKQWGNVNYDNFIESLVELPFNPTAENMAQYLLDVVGPQQLDGTGVKLVKVVIEETSKCSVTAEV